MADEHHVPRAPFYIRVKTPTVIQMEVVECGAASLGIILGYFGKYVTLEELRTACGVTRDGVNALSILSAAENYGLKCEGFRLELEELYDMPLPLIAYWNFEHFIVIEGFSREGVFVNDPAFGPMTITYEELDSSFTGLALTFSLTDKFVKSGKPESVISGIVNRLKVQKTAFLFSIIVGFCLIVPKLALPAFAQIFIDEIFVNQSFTWQNGFLLSMAVIAVIALSFEFLQFLTLGRLFIQLSIDFSYKYFYHVLRLPIGFYAQRFSGEIANRADINNSVAQMIFQKLAILIIDVMMVIFFGVIMFYYDPLVAALGISMTLCNLAIMSYLFRSRKDAYASFQQSVGKSMGYAIGILGNIETIKAASSEYKTFNRWAGYYTKTLNAQQIIAKKEVIAGAIPTFLETLTTIAVLGLGSYRVISGSLTIGMLIALRILMANFMSPITRLVDFSQQIRLLQVDISRLDDVLKNPIDPVLVREEEETEIFKLQGEVEFKNVTFGFNPLSDPILSDVSFKLTPGQSLGLVGPTGCGKSTIAKLLAGLYEPWSGEIVFDGISKKELARSVITESLMMVEQDPYIFAGSVKDNITCFEILPEQHDMIKAAQDACIHDDIMLRKGGYELQLESEGKNLSGGQRQRLEIARALIKKPVILIMDEATSALDSETELKVTNNIRRLGCTLIVIAHRLSTVRHCDEIVVLDKGKVKQRGHHQQLFDEGGPYRELVELENETVVTQV